MPNTQLKTYFIISGVLILGLIFGYMLGLNQGLEQGRKEIEEKYQTKIEELYPALSEPEEIFSVGGEIKEIKDKTLILEIGTPAANPFEEPKTETKIVKIIEATEFVKAVQKSPEEMVKEQEDFLEAKKENPEVEILPVESFKKERSILFSDLKVGNIIKVETEENVKGKTEFTAKKIILLILQPREE